MFQAAVDSLRRRSRSQEILVLAPTTEAARHLVRSACETAFVGVHASTPRTYARDLLRSGPTAIHSVVHQAICARIAHTERLSYFTSVAKMPGFAKALARTIREVRLHGAEPGGDIGVLASAYERELRDRSLADDAALYKLALGSDIQPMPSIAYALEPEWHMEAQFVSWLKPMESFVPQLPESPVSALESVQRYLFSDEVPAARSADDSFHVFGVATEAQECVEIARAILTRKARFDECAVLLRQPGRYGPLVAEAFRRAGIPVWFARGSRGPDVAGRALLVLLHCANEGLSARRMGEYLSLRAVPELNPARWERIVSNAHVIGGIDRWRRRLNAISRESDELERLRSFVLPLVDRLHSLPRQASWGEWLDALGELVESSVREGEGVLEALDELSPMRDIGPVGLEDVIQLLSEHLRSSRSHSDEYRYGHVWVGSIEEARGLSFRHVFVPGVAEGVFPRARREDPLLLDEQRRELGMREATDLPEQRLLMQAALCATESLTLSYGRIDLETGRPRVPSLYLYAALRASGTGMEIASPTVADPVDEFEYDSQALQSRAAGSGAYLKHANRFLYASLLARYRRWESDGKWHESDGLNVIEPALSEYRPTVRAYSVSALETFAMCPYRFFLQGVMRLREVEHSEPLQRMDPAVRGDIFHRILAEVLRECDVPVTPANLDAALIALDRVMERVGVDEAERRAPSVMQVWNEELRRMRADLRGWLSKMAHEDTAWTPIAFELKFGFDEPLDIGNGFLLKGSVDLVERHASGHLRVTDYKTGPVSEPLPRSIGKGEVLQPALYSLAVEQLMNEKVSSARLYHSTLRANFRSVPIRVPNEQTMTVLEAIDQAVDGGQLLANPREDACEFCAYKVVCGPYEEQRVKRKPKDQTLTLIRKCE